MNRAERRHGRPEDVQLRAWTERWWAIRKARDVEKYARKHRAQREQERSERR